MIQFRLDQLVISAIQLLISHLRERERENRENLDQTFEDSDRNLPWPTGWQTFYTNDGILVLSSNPRVLFGFPRRAIDQRLKNWIIALLEDVSAADDARYERHDQRLCNKRILHGVNLKKFGEFLSGHPKISCSMNPIFGRSLYIKVYRDCYITRAEGLNCKIEAARELASRVHESKHLLKVDQKIKSHYRKAINKLDEKKVTLVKISQVEGKQLVHIYQKRKPYVNDLIFSELPTLEKELVRFKAIHGLFNLVCSCSEDDVKYHHF